MRMTVLIDDVVPEGIRPVHGFAALLESEDGIILFDTGPDGGLLLEALDRVGVVPADLDLLVLSHHHRDHSGGAARILYERPRLEVSVPVGSAGRFAKALPRTAVIHGERGMRQLLPGISTTGDLGGDVPEHALTMETSAGRGMLTGCGHPGVARLLAATAGPVDVIVGGLHELTVEDLPLPGVGRVVACHCTPRKRVLAQLVDQVGLGHVGAVLELEGRPSTGGPSRRARTGE